MHLLVVIFNLCTMLRGGGGGGNQLLNFLTSETPLYYTGLVFGESTTVVTSMQNKNIHS